MIYKSKFGLGIIFGVISLTVSNAQNFPGPVGDPTTTAVHKLDNSIDYWLSDSISVTRGYKNIADQSLGLAAVGYPQNALGESNPEIISLGDGGEAIYVLSNSISDIEGYDFAVFENSFDNQFLEFAFVEVSTNGEDYVRFPNQCNIDGSEQTGGFGLTDTKYIHNLAGKYRAQYGTPFDLSELEDSLGLDIDDINYIKIVDVVGSIDPNFATYDSYGNVVNDPWPTPFASSGFDLDALAILKHIPLNIEELNEEMSFVNNTLIFENLKETGHIQINDVLGKTVYSGSVESQINLGFLNNGIYVVTLIKNEAKEFLKIKIN